MHRTKYHKLLAYRLDWRRGLLHCETPRLRDLHGQVNQLFGCHHRQDFLCSPSLNIYLDTIACSPPGAILSDGPEPGSVPHRCDKLPFKSHLVTQDVGMDQDDDTSTVPCDFGRDSKGLWYT